MSSDLANGKTEENAEKPQETAPSSVDKPDAQPDADPAENGLDYSPHVERKVIIAESHDVDNNTETDCVVVSETVKTSSKRTLTSATSIEQELVKGLIAGDEGIDGEIVVTSEVKRTVTKTTRTITTEGVIVEEVKDETAGDSEAAAGTKEAEDAEKSPEEEDPLWINPPHYSIPEVGDRLKPAKSVVTTNPEDAVILRYTNSGPAADPPMLVTSMLDKTAAKYPQRTALGVKRDNEWKIWNYTEFVADIKAVAKAFIEFGLERFHGVAILGFNSPEWFISNFAAIYAGGLSTGIYATNSPEACEWTLKNSRSNVCVVENDKQLEKILSVWENLPDLQAVIQWSGKPSCEGNPRVHYWPEIVEMGRTLPGAKLEQRMEDLAANECCSLIYTSGTTGNSKGVMLSHDNLTWNAAQCAKLARVMPGEETGVSYLPLSHIAAQILDFYIPYCSGASIFVAQPDALKGSLVNTLQEVKPTILLGVPRVWEKIQEKLIETGTKAPALKKSIVRWAKSVGAKGNTALDKGEELPVSWSVANSFVFKKVRRALGLSKCKLMFTGAAPIMLETLEFYRSLNLRILDAYGLSECTAPHSLQLPDRYRFGSSGKVINGTITHIDKPEEDGTGEICMEGRHVFMGYLNNRERTLEAIDKNGWLHSGDVGKLDEDGYLFITGRIKELIITAGGENIPPVAIEDELKTELPVISKAMLIGDRCKFLSVLLTLKTEVDPDTNIPRDRLAPLTLQWVQSLGSQSTTITEIIDKTDLAVLKAIQVVIDKVNKGATSQAQRIQKWTLLPRDFSIPGGELGPTMKMRRPIILKMYKDTIESFYQQK